MKRIIFSVFSICMWLLSTFAFADSGAPVYCGPTTGVPCPSRVPEPTTIVLLVAGLAGVGLLRKRFKK